jgi:hypothetical protein
MIYFGTSGRSLAGKIREFGMAVELRAWRSEDWGIGGLGIGGLDWNLEFGFWILFGIWNLN